MSETIDLITGNPYWGSILALLTVFGAFGIGKTILGKDGPLYKPAAVILGLNVMAFLNLAFCGFIPVQWVFSATVAAGLIPAVRGVKKASFAYFPAILLPMFFFASVLTPPGGWDECVYQLAIPRKWAVDGFPQFYETLPYSGFPLLPQFLYWPLVKLSGISAAKALNFFVLSIFAFSLFSFIRNRFAANVLTVSLLLSPMVLILYSGTYAECFIALDLAAFLILTKGKINVPALGILAGGACAVKLGGCFVAAAMLGFLLIRRERWRDIIGFGITAFLILAPFYARSCYLTGNPLYPYFAEFFTNDGTEQMVSAYHHAIGKTSFGIESASSFLTAPWVLSLKHTLTVYDGGYGLQLMLWLAASLWLFVKMRRRFYALMPWLVMGGILYTGWFFTSQQARFLLPCVLIPVILCGKVMTGMKKRNRILFGILLLVSAAFSIRFAELRQFSLQWKHCNDRVNVLYSKTGPDYLPLMEHNKPLLLLLEERILYLPHGSVVATPFFQRKFFTPPELADEQTILDLMNANGLSGIYFRIPENNPDLNADFLERSAKLLPHLRNLTEKGILSCKHLSKNGILYEKRL